MWILEIQTSVIHGRDVQYKKHFTIQLFNVLRVDAENIGKGVTGTCRNSFSTVFVHPFAGTVKTGDWNNQ